MFSKAGLAIFLLTLHGACGEPFRLARGYGTDMVLQMEPKRAALWGRGEPGAEVTLTLDQQLPLKTDVSEEGTWELKLPPQPAGGPHVLEFEHVEAGGNTTRTTLEGVLFGDVWLCFGEGNMEFFFASLDNYEEEAVLAEKYFAMRLFHVGRGEAEEEQLEIGTNIERQWTTLNNESLEWYSAECALFGEMMSDALPARPVGVIEFAWTKTPLQSWLPPSVMQECNLPPPYEPHPSSGVHNAIVAPLSRFTVRGVLWDHGESVTELNALNSTEFLCATYALVANWRSSFSEGDVPADQGNVSFPVGIVQLGPDSSDSLSNTSAPVRLFQSILVDTEGNETLVDVFTAATYDLVDNSSSRDWFTKQFKAKRIVAERLLSSAKELLYNEDPGSSLITFKQVEADSAGIQLEFDSDIAVSGTSGFAVSDSVDGTWTQVQIQSVSGRMVRLESMEGAESVWLSYAASTTPCLHLNCSIYDIEGLPLQPRVIQITAAATAHGSLRPLFVLLVVLIKLF